MMKSTIRFILFCAQAVESMMVILLNCSQNDSGKISKFLSKEIFLRDYKLAMDQLIRGDCL